MSTVFEELIRQLAGRKTEIKELKKHIKELEGDVPMELEDAMMELKELKKRCKDLKEAHLNHLLSENASYVEYRERMQDLKEQEAEARVALLEEAGNLSREHGSLDRTVVVEGHPYRLQTENAVQVFLDGKAVK